jgi:hypothetical protein
MLHCFRFISRPDLGQVRGEARRAVENGCMQVHHPGESHRRQHDLFLDKRKRHHASGTAL